MPCMTCGPPWLACRQHCLVSFNATQPHALCSDITNNLASQQQQNFTHAEVLPTPLRGGVEMQGETWSRCCSCHVHLRVKAHSCKTVVPSFEPGTDVQHLSAPDLSCGQADSGTDPPVHPVTGCTGCYARPPNPVSTPWPAFIPQNHRTTQPELVVMLICRCIMVLRST